MWKLTHFPLKEVLGEKGVQGAPHARARAKSVSKFKLFWRARRAQDPIHFEDPFQGKSCFSKLHSQIDVPKSEHWKLVSAKGPKILGPKMDAIGFSGHPL
jgi:hypothetical protein